jgi:hypothetical protein
MNENIKKLVEQAGFSLWEDEAWGPGPGHIDWSSNYDAEFKNFAELMIKACADIALREDHDPYECILKHFGVK